MIWAIYVPLFLPFFLLKDCPNAIVLVYEKRLLQYRSIRKKGAITDLCFVTNIVPLPHATLSKTTKRENPKADSISCIRSHRSVETWKPELSICWKNPRQWFFTSHGSESPRDANQKYARFRYQILFSSCSADRTQSLKAVETSVNANQAVGSSRNSFPLTGSGTMVLIGTHRPCHRPLSATPPCYIAFPARQPLTCERRNKTISVNLGAEMSFTSLLVWAISDTISWTKSKYPCL